MLADQTKSEKSALTTKGLRLLRETPFEPPALRAISALVAGDNYRLARKNEAAGAADAAA
jgi:hypothetical protein